MKQTTLALVLIALACGCAARRDPQAMAPLEVLPRQVPVNGVPTLSTASVSYGNMAVFVSSPKGAAVVAFFDSYNGGGGVHYRYRFVPADGGEEIRGDDEVYWKIQPLGENQFRDIGSRLNVVAGEITFEWSNASPYGGWIYFNPATMQMKRAKTTEFDVLDLRRALPPTTRPAVASVASRDRM